MEVPFENRIFTYGWAMTLHRQNSDVRKQHLVFIGGNFDGRIDYYYRIVCRSLCPSNQPLFTFSLRLFSSTN